MVFEDIIMILWLFFLSLIVVLMINVKMESKGLWFFLLMMELVFGVEGLVLVRGFIFNNWFRWIYLFSLIMMLSG